MRPRLLDVYSCAGGASVGYFRAGFHVTGVDKEPQSNYPFRFIQADALEVLADRKFIAQFDAIHASPPCQFKALATLSQRRNGKEYPDLITPTRPLLGFRPAVGDGERAGHSAAAGHPAVRLHVRPRAPRCRLPEA